MTTDQIRAADLPVRSETIKGRIPAIGGPLRRAVILDATAAPSDHDGHAALDALHDRVRGCHGDVLAILQLARELGASTLQAQTGKTLDFWQVLATLGAADLTAARIIEPHLDALSILEQAGRQELNVGDSTWGVFAAQGPDQQLTAVADRDGWRLTGEKPWCSMADSLSHALVTARAGNNLRLFAVELQHPGVASTGRPWQAVGLPSVPSSGLRFHNVPSVAVGLPGWYLQRPGFSWGGAGVGAIWFGASTALARRLHQHCLSRTPDQIALWQLGTVDRALWSATAAFQAAATAAETGPASARDGAALPALTAARLRAVVVETAEAVLAAAAHGMGPEPLAFEAEHAQRVADLELYLRQDHAERSLAAHGAALLAAGTSAAPGAAPW